MLVVGLAFLMDWFLIAILSVAVDRAALITAVVLILLAFLVGEHPWHKP